MENKMRNVWDIKRNKIFLYRSYCTIYHCSILKAQNIIDAGRNKNRYFYGASNWHALQKNICEKWDLEDIWSGNKELENPQIGKEI